MKKIFVYAGSNHPQSSTEYLMEVLLNRLREKTGGGFSAEIYSGSSTQITECTGCTGCFWKGSCKLDKEDEMERIKSRMQEADLIILGSPVYFHNVSGNMKTFIDRISYWTHTMELTGAYGVTVAVSGGNGEEYVTNYLKKLYDYLGVHSLYSIEVAAYSREYMMQHQVLDQMEEQLEACTDAIIRHLWNQEKVLEFGKKETIFRCLKKKNQQVKEYQDQVKEIYRWFEKGFGECRNFSEAFYRNTR